MRCTFFRGFVRVKLEIYRRLLNDECPPPCSSVLRSTSCDHCCADHYCADHCCADHCCADHCCANHCCANRCCADQFTGAVRTGNFRPAFCRRVLLQD